MSKKRSYADACGIARALDTVGERWALMVVRELLLGPKRFTDLRASLPTIGPDVLTQRLKDLEAAGIASKRKLPPPAASTVYELTPAGTALRGVLDELGRWGAVFAPAPAEGMCMSLDSHVLSMRTLFDATRAEGYDARVALELDGQPFHAVVHDGAMTIDRGTIETPDVTIAGAAGEVIDVMHGRAALADPSIEIRGDRALGERYLQLAPLPHSLRGMDLLASVDGTIAPAAEQTVSITDEGLLRGDGVFEVARLYNGVPFAMDDHFKRMQRSADGLRLEFDLIALQREIAALLEEVGPVDALLRVVLTRGGRRIVIVEPKPTPPEETATVATVEYVPNRVLDTLKTLSYAGNMLAGRLAKEAGADEALFVTPHGRVLEGPTWTFFWVRDGRLLTPPLEDRILHSITRERIMQVTDAEEVITTRDDLAAAEEAFIASSVREVLPISAIDGREMPSAPGPVTSAAATAFREHVAACVSSPS